MISLAALVGISGGFILVLYHISIDELNHFFFNFIPQLLPVAIQDYTRIIIPAFGGLIIAIIFMKIPRYEKEYGAPAVMDSVVNPLEELQSLLDNSEQAEITSFFERLNSHDVVYVMSHLSRDEQMMVLRAIKPLDAASIMEEIPESQAAEIVEDLSSQEAAAILNEMPSDEQADILSELDSDEAEEIIARMKPEEAADVRKLIDYDPEVAGGLMITEFLSFEQSKTIESVVGELKDNREVYQKLHIKYIYITRENGSFLGVLQIQDLLLADPSFQLSEILIPDVLSVQHHATLDELVDFFHTHDFYGVPVLDDQGFLLGVVLRKDVLEAAVEHASIEHLESQGIVGGEELRTMPVLLRSRRRLSWLSINIVLNMVAASVIAYHQETLSSVIALAVFLPIISDMSGCSGNQAVAVSMRELALGVVRPGEAFRVWIQEVSVGMINGLALGVLLALGAYLWQGNVYLGLVVGGALMLNTMLAVSLGGTVPLLLKKGGVDPALASGPILTTVTDMAGFFLTLTFASMALHHLA